MKKQSRKLNLNRETLIPLQADELFQINGGQVASSLTITSLPTTSTLPTVTSLPTLTRTISLGGGGNK